MHRLDGEIFHYGLEVCRVGKHDGHLIVGLYTLFTLD